MKVAYLGFESRRTMKEGEIRKRGMPVNTAVGICSGFYCCKIILKFSDIKQSCYVYRLCRSGFWMGTKDLSWQVSKVRVL